MMRPEIFYAIGGFLCGGLCGTILQHIVIQWVLLNDVYELPWMVKTKLTRHFGWFKWSKACAEVEACERASYATILIGTLHDLGGPRLLAPKSKAAFDGMIAEAERRYAITLKERKKRR